MTFFQPLFKSLKRKSVLPEMVAGLDMIVQDIKQRNYLHAYDIYMRLAIGEQPLQPPLSIQGDPAMSSMKLLEDCDGLLRFQLPSEDSQFYQRPGCSNSKLCRGAIG